MSTVAFDTLKLAQGLEAAGFPVKQAQDMARVFSETMTGAVVTPAYLDLRLAELRAGVTTDIVEAKADMLKWMFGAVGLQTLAILGGVAALLKLIGH